MAVISNTTTIIDAGAITSGSGAMTLIKTLTASSSANLQFLNGTSNVVFDGTYKEYQFHCINIHPASDGEPLTFQVDTGTNTNFNIATTNTFFRARHNEGDTISSLAYVASYDQAEGTAFIRMNGGVGNGNDECCSMILTIYEPANTTFVKHYAFTGNNYQDNSGSENLFSAGYFNTTTALTRIQFKMGSGNIDSGTIKMYGIS
jgi:hypothetical protein